jgi:hypothetical protein
MSKFNSIPRAGWVIIGLVLALLLVPTMAVAATVTYNGIKGTNGTTTTQNKADVSSDGQLLTTEASPTNYFTHVATWQYEQPGSEIATTTTEGLIVQEIHLAWYNASAEDAVQLFIDAAADPDGACSSENNPDVKELADAAYLSPANGFMALPYEPGLAVPNGYDLCIQAVAKSATGFAYVYGYSVPADDVPGFSGPRAQPLLHIKR